MPSSPGGVSKSLRIQTIIDILNRAGSLDKNEILHRLAVSLDLDKEQLERALYRDLEELVKDNKLQVFSRDSLGRIVEDETEETKKYKKYWHTEKFHPFDIQGVGLLRRINANLICNKQIVSYLAISESQKSVIDKNNQRILIQVNNELFTLVINNIVLPLKIIISRKIELKDAVLEKIYKNYGKKVLIILLNDQILSSIKENNIKGEFVIDYQIDSVGIINENKKLIQLKDFDSNKDLELIGSSQKTRNRTEVDNFVQEFETASELEIKNIKKPFIIKWTSCSIVLL